jgi:hypothetical protein
VPIVSRLGSAQADARSSPLNKIRDRVGLENGTKMQAWMHPCQVQAYEELGQAVHVINRTNAKEQGLDLYYERDSAGGCPGQGVEFLG